MTKPVIITRAGKGSALTWAEGDTNLTNLQNATLTVSDGTNSKALDLNDTLSFVAGTNITLSVDNTTGAVTINSSGGSTSPAGGDGQLQYSMAGLFSASSSLTWDGTTLNTTALNSPKLIFKEPRESIYINGTVTGSFFPNAANGSVQSLTIVGGSITINGFASAQAGQSITLIMTMGGAGYTLSSTMKFAGGQKTISTTANAIDIMTIYYDGTNYYASLSKGFV